MENILFIVGPFMTLAYTGFSLKFLIWLLGNLKVILPVSINDLKNREKIISENKLKKGKQDLYLLRSCTIEEYYYNSTNSNCLNNIGIFLIFLVGSICYYVIVVVYIKFIKKDEDKTYDLEYLYNNFLSFSYSLVIVSFIFVVYRLFNRKNIITTIYVFIVLTGTLIVMNFLNKNSFIEIPNIFKIDEKSICNSIENRISKIIKKSKELNAINLFSENDDKKTENLLCNKDSLIIFAIIFFSISSSIIYDISKITSKFNFEFFYKKINYDTINVVNNFIIKNDSNSSSSSTSDEDEKKRNSLDNSFSYKYLIQIIKFKYIISMIIWTLLFDEITFDLIFTNVFEFINAKKEIIYGTLIFALVSVDSFLGLLTVKYYWFTMNQDNYMETMKLTDINNTKTIDNEYISFYTRFCLKNNELSFELLEKFVYYSSICLIAVLTIIFKFSILNEDDITMKTWFSEYIVFLILISVYVCKSIFEILYLFYLVSKNFK